MSPNIEIQNVPGDVHRVLSERAAAAGKTLQDHLRDHLVTQAAHASDLIAFAYDETEVIMPDSGGIMATHYRSGRFYEQPMLTAIEEVGRAGTYLDVGANVGNHSVFFEMFCPSTKVIAFEPANRPFEYLLRARDANSLGFEAYEVGLSDRHETLQFQMNSMTFTIQVRPLDDLQLTDIAVVKVDVEGMEPRVLSGMTQTLIQNSPHIYMEANSLEDLSSQEEILTRLDYVRSGRVWNASPTYEWVKKPRFHVRVTKTLAKVLDR